MYPLVAKDAQLFSPLFLLEARNAQITMLYKNNKNSFSMIFIAKICNTFFRVSFSPWPPFWRTIPNRTQWPHKALYTLFSKKTQLNMKNSVEQKFSFLSSWTSCTYRFYLSRRSLGTTVMKAVTFGFSLSRVVAVMIVRAYFQLSSEYERKTTKQNYDFLCNTLTF